MSSTYYYYYYYYYYHCHCYTYSDKDPCQIDRDPCQIDRDLLDGIAVGFSRSGANGSLSLS